MAATALDDEAARRVARRVRAARAVAWAQALANVGWPVAAFATVAGHAERLGLPAIAEMGVLGPFVVGLLPLTLMAWMQVAAGAAGALDGRGWALGIVAPLAVALLASGAAGVAWVAFEMGALYLAALLAAYFWIVWVRPLAGGRLGSLPPSERRFYLFAAAAQGVFLVPGLVSLGIFGVVLAAGAEHEPLVWAAYGAAWIGLTAHEIRWMKAVAWSP